ncbi:MAG TPA: glycosyltransferase family 39 protein [Pyrinomonadaceae bacterium]
MQPTEKNQKIFFADKFSLFARLGTGVLGVLFLSLIISRLAFPFDNGILEAFNWLPAQHILEGKNPYAFALTPPYSMTPYGAVFYALLAAGQKLFGFQLWWGRILSVLAFAFCLWALAKITKKITGDKEAALIAFLAGLAMFPAQFWIGSVRPDLIAFAFVAGALWLIFTRVEENEKTSVWIVAGIVLLSGAAFFTKQTFFFTAGIAFLRFLQLGKRREAVLTVLAFAALTTAGIFLLNYTSGGGYVWQHWTHAQRLTFSWYQVIDVFFKLLKTPVIFFALVFLFIFIYGKRKFLFQSRREKLFDALRSPELLILFYFLISLGWAFVSSGRVGANANYYIESSLLLAIVVGFSYSNFKRNSLPRLALAMIVLFTLGGAFQVARILHGEYFRWQTVGYYREILHQTAKFTTPGSTCISVAAELVVWNDCRFQFDDFSEYEHGWSPELREAFEREVKTGRYAAILWYDDALQTRFPNYRLVPMSQSAPERSFPIYLYVPAASAP